VKAAIRAEFRLLWRGYVLPICLIVCALFAIANVVNQIAEVHSDYSLVQHTRADYAANGMDFAADLAKPAKIVIHGDEQTVTNLARFDYDNEASAIVALSPASSVTEALKYFGFIFFPALFFLLGLWMSTVQRRYHLEKIVIARKGTVTTVAARQIALLGAAVLTIATVIVVDLVCRAVATAVTSRQLPFGAYPPLSPEPADSPILQWALVLLVVLFFGGAGISVGAALGVFAIPAILFLIWDLVIPFLGPDDPRNWFVAMGHSVFDFTSGFQLAPADPLPLAIAVGGGVLGAAVLLALGYLCIRIRNPLAS